MTRKRFVKLLMSNGMSKRQATDAAQKVRKATGFTSYADAYRGFADWIGRILSEIQNDIEKAYGIQMEAGQVSAQMLQNRDGELRVEVACMLPVTEITFPAAPMIGYGPAIPRLNKDT